MLFGGLQEIRTLELVMFTIVTFGDPGGKLVGKSPTEIANASDMG